MPEKNSAELKINSIFKAAYESDMTEVKKSKNIMSDGSVILKFRPKEIKTLILEI